MSKTVEEVGLIVGGLALGGVAGLAYFGFLPFGMAAGPAITLTSLPLQELLRLFGPFEPLNRQTAILNVPRANVDQLRTP